jgi:hypothetical protein
MDNLNRTLARSLAERFGELAKNVKALAEALSEEQFWKKPFEFGNSFGHLLLHLTGNLNYYIGAQIANTGYARDRPLEFAATERPAKQEVLKRFDAAVEMVIKTIGVQSESDWDRAYAAKGEEDAKNRLTVVLRCLTHLDHHVGQMQYLSFALGG